MNGLASFRTFLRSEDARASAAVESLMAFEQQDWVTIFKDEPSDEGDVLRIACLIRPAGVENALHQASFDFSPGDGRPGFVGSSSAAGEWTAEYRAVGTEMVIPLVFDRFFSGPFPNVMEVAEDFRLFWDLYEDRSNNRFVTTDELGDTVIVAHWQDTEFRVLKRYLRRYQAARQLALSLQVVVDRRGGVEIQHLAAVNEEVSENNVHFVYHGGSGLLSDERRNFTRLLGKRVILPPPIDQAGVWPYEAPVQYETFTIGMDIDGEPIENTCDPDALANYFDKNSGSPHYLTPVFFDRSVFDKYYADTDRYEVGDGYLHASGAWGLRMDDALQEHVAVFLGDLGTDLPHREQEYWKSFNVQPLEQMSETAIRRSFLGQFYDSEGVEHRFAASYERLNAAWDSRFGWPLFKPLHQGDSHLAHSIHVPTNTSFAQFDDQIVRLAKLVVDSLNEERIVLDTIAPEKGEKGIAKLERLLGELGIDSDPLCSQLRVIQGARTRSAAHRKGRDFDVDTLLSGASDLRALIAEHLEELIDQFDTTAEYVA